MSTPAATPKVSKIPTSRPASAIPVKKPVGSPTAAAATPAAKAATPTAASATPSGLRKPTTVTGIAKPANSSPEVSASSPAATPRTATGATTARPISARPVSAVAKKPAAVASPPAATEDVPLTARERAKQKADALAAQRGPAGSLAASANKAKQLGARPAATKVVPRKPLTAAELAAKTPSAIGIVRKPAVATATKSAAPKAVRSGAATTAAGALQVSAGASTAASVADEEEEVVEETVEEVVEVEETEEGDAGEEPTAAEDELDALINDVDNGAGIEYLNSQAALSAGSKPSSALSSPANKINSPKSPTATLGNTSPVAAKRRTKSPTSIGSHEAEEEEDDFDMLDLPINDDTIIAPPLLSDDHDESSDLIDDSPARLRAEKQERDRLEHQRKLSEAKAFLSDGGSVSQSILSGPTVPAVAAIVPNDAFLLADRADSSSSIAPEASSLASTQEVEYSKDATTIAPSTSVSSAGSSSGGVDAVASPRRSVLLDSTDDDDDLHKIGIGGSSSTSQPKPLNVITHHSTASIDLPSGPLSSPTKGLSVAESLRQMELLRRKEEDERKARQQEDLEQRRKKAESDRKAKEEEDARRKEEERKAREAAEQAVLEAKRQAEEQANARAAKEAAELKAGTEGVDLLKVPRSGGAKLTHVKVHKSSESSSTGAAQWFIQWGSKKKSEEESRMLINECDLTLGLISGQFLKKKWRADFKDSRQLCFSILGPQRSLDLVAQNVEDFDLFVGFLKRLPFATFKDGRGTADEEAAAVE